MFTQLVTSILTLLGNVPLPLVYAIVAVWIGIDCAGIPLPMEPVLLFAGALGATGRASAALAILSAVLGSLALASLAYHLGRRFGAPAITRVGRRIGFTQARADHMELWLRHRGVLGVIFASIAPGIRTFSAYMMGIAEVPHMTFLFGVFVGTVIYSSIWIMVGQTLGANYRAPLRYLDRIGLFGIALAAIVAGTAILLHHLWGQHARQRVAAHFHHFHEHKALALQTPHASASGQPEVAQEPVSQGSGVLALDHTPSQTLHIGSTQQGGSLMADAPSSDSASMPAVGKPSSHRAHLNTPTRWPQLMTIDIAVFWGIGALLFAVMASYAHTYAQFPYDAPLSAWIQQVRTTPFAEPIKLAGDLQWFLPTGIALALIFGTLLVLRLYLEAICLAIASFGTDLINVILNTLVARPRPHGVHIQTLVSNLGQQSFPSGHVAHTVGLYGFVFFLCLFGMRAYPRWRPWLIAVQVICVYFIVFVGASRIVEGAHWPSDVAAGYLVGGLMLAIAISLYHVLALRRAQKLA